MDEDGKIENEEITGKEGKREGKRGDWNGSVETFVAEDAKRKCKGASKISPFR